jgi:hypothetical protein
MMGILSHGQEVNMKSAQLKGVQERVEERRVNCAAEIKELEDSLAIKRRELQDLTDESGNVHSELAELEKQRVYVVSSFHSFMAHGGEGPAPGSGPAAAFLGESSYSHSSHSAVASQSSSLSPTSSLGSLPLRGCGGRQHQVGGSYFYAAAPASPSEAQRGKAARITLACTPISKILESSAVRRANESGGNEDDLVQESRAVSDHLRSAGLTYSTLQSTARNAASLAQAAGADPNQAGFAAVVDALYEQLVGLSVGGRSLVVPNALQTQALGQANEIAEALFQSK